MTTTRPLTAPNLVATGGGEESSLAMADDEVRVLWCLIQGNSTVFKVTASVDVDVSDLKKLVQEEHKNGMLSTTDAADLELWKACNSRGKRGQCS